MPKLTLRQTIAALRHEIEALHVFYNMPIVVVRSYKELERVRNIRGFVKNECYAYGRPRKTEIGMDATSRYCMWFANG